MLSRPESRSSSERRLDRSFRRRFLWRNSVLFLLTGAFWLAVWFQRERLGAPLWLLGVLFLAWMLGWVIADVRSFRRYRCPECKQTLPKPTAGWNAGEAIVYSCARCAIEWDTGLRVSDG